MQTNFSVISTKTQILEQQKKTTAQKEVELLAAAAGIMIGMSNDRPPYALLGNVSDKLVRLYETDRLLPQSTKEIAKATAASQNCAAAYENLGKISDELVDLYRAQTGRRFQFKQYKGNDTNTDVLLFLVAMGEKLAKNEATRAHAVRLFYSTYRPYGNNTNLDDAVKNDVNFRSIAGIVANMEVLSPKQQLFYGEFIFNATGNTEDARFAWDTFHYSRKYPSDQWQFHGLAANALITHIDEASPEKRQELLKMVLGSHPPADSTKLPTNDDDPSTKLRVKAVEMLIKIAPEIADLQSFLLDTKAYEKATPAQQSTLIDLCIERVKQDPFERRLNHCYLLMYKKFPEGEEGKKFDLADLIAEALADTDNPKDVDDFLRRSRTREFWGQDLNDYIREKAEQIKASPSVPANEASRIAKLALEKLNIGRPTAG